MENSRDDFVIAIRSAFLKKGTQQRFSLFVLILFSIIFLILGSWNLKVIDYVKISLKEIVYRASFIVSGPENLIKKSYLIVNSHFSLYEENEKNASEIEIFKLKELSKEILILENIKYKRLIDDYFIKENETYAKVLIDKQSPFLRSVIINKGSKNNVKLGMIVLDEGYLVGKVVSVNYFTARVLLLSDINSKIPVSLQPGDTQAIMSGNGQKTGILQYTKDSTLIKNTEDLLVLTSGAGGVFKSGIPVGKILKENYSSGEQKLVNFYKDFTQLKYVKVVSFSKDKTSLDEISKVEQDELNEQIEESNQRQETLRILLEQKKIAEEIRLTIENENTILKNENIKLQNQILKQKNIIQKSKLKKENLEYLELNATYGAKCRKTFFNNLYKEGTVEYKNCVLRKGKKE